MAKKKNQQEVIETFRKIHKDKYDYSLVRYVNIRTKVKIICKVHGIFKQVPHGHIHNKRGCLHCANDSFRLGIKIFIKRANKIHNFKYDYSLVKYINALTNITIKCPIHGIFEQLPNNHLNGQGCFICNTPGGYSKLLFESRPELKNTPAILYFIKLYNLKEIFYKTGITTKTTTIRFKNIQKYKYSIISEIKTTLYNAFLEEQNFLKNYKEYKYIPHYKFGGHTECFNKEIYNKMFKPTEDIV